jgi:hypothetical protein
VLPSICTFQVLRSIGRHHAPTTSTKKRRQFPDGGGRWGTARTCSHQAASVDPRESTRRRLRGFRSKVTSQRTSTSLENDLAVFDPIHTTHYRGVILLQQSREA